jgi:hypothetical protein
MDSKEDILLYGTDSTPKYQSLLFYISKCRNKDLLGTGLVCKSDKEIDDFIEELVVNGFTVTDKIDFSLFNRKPV